MKTTLLSAACIVLLGISSVYAADATKTEEKTAASKPVAMSPATTVAKTDKKPVDEKAKNTPAAKEDATKK